MLLLDRWDIIKNRKRYNLRPGCVEKIFEIHENNASDESNFLPIIIKPTVEDKQKKRSIN